MGFQFDEVSGLESYGEVWRRRDESLTSNTLDLDENLVGLYH